MTVAKNTAADTVASHTRRFVKNQTNRPNIAVSDATNSIVALPTDVRISNTETATKAKVSADCRFVLVWTDMVLLSCVTVLIGG